MKGIDLIKTLPDELKVAVQGDVAEEYSHNWWENMVKDSRQLATGEDYLSHRSQADERLIDLLIANGSTEKHKTSSGKYVIGSIFTTKKAYNNYRSNKSIIAKALDNGVLLFNMDGTTRPKSAVQQELKEVQVKPVKSLYEVAVAAASKFMEVWPMLTKEEQDSITSGVLGGM